jgi:hypothetical protein
VGARGGGGGGGGFRVCPWSAHCRLTQMCDDICNLQQHASLCSGSLAVCELERKHVRAALAKYHPFCYQILCAQRKAHRPKRSASRLYCGGLSRFCICGAKAVLPPDSHRSSSHAVHPWIHANCIVRCEIQVGEIVLNYGKTL